MDKGKKTLGSMKDWETGKLGQDANYARPSPPEREAAVDDALELKMISIRLQNELISNLKFVAEHHGIGYQPLIRDLLHRFVRAEMRDILHNLQESQDDEDAFSDEDSPVAKFFQDGRKTA